MIECNEIISVMNIVSTKKTNTIATNVSINCHTKKVREYYILHIVLLAIILLLIITIISYYYIKHRSKHKYIDALTIYKWKIMNLIKFALRTVGVIISMT